MDSKTVNNKSQLLDSSNICVVITTYRPDGRFQFRVERVKENNVGFIIIVNDGQCSENKKLLSEWFDNTTDIVVYHNDKNIGIAASLNKGISIATERGFQWILTLDDDTFIAKDMVVQLINYLSVINEKTVGIIGMSWEDPNVGDLGKKKRNINSLWQEKRGIITSGALFSLSTYNVVGPFREDFFIGSVDYDYCLRIRAKGLKVIKINEIGFEHTLGNTRTHDFFGIKFQVSNHDATRLYYEFRNLIVLSFEQTTIDPLYVLAAYKYMLLKVLSIVFFEQNKIRKIHHILVGVFDGLRKQLGKTKNISGE